MKRRGLSTIVGAVFFVLVMGSTIGYVTYSMDVIDDLAYQVDVKQDTNLNRQSEEFKITDVRVDGTEFNLTVTNTGTIPINITKMWAKNVTDSTWNQTSYPINQVVAPGGSFTDVGIGTGLIAMDSQSYTLKLLTSRGNTLETQVFSASNLPIEMSLLTNPTSPLDDQDVTLQFTVKNNLTNGAIIPLLTPQMATAGVIVSTEVGTVTPPSYQGLNPGETVTFEWAYTVTGNEDDTETFTASLQNGVAGNNVSDTVIIDVAPTAYESFESELSRSFGKLFLNYTTFEACEPSADDCFSDNTDWGPGWDLKKGRDYIYRIEVRNTNTLDYLLEDKTSILMLQARDTGIWDGGEIFYILKANTPSDEGPTNYTNFSESITKDDGIHTVYFGAAGTGPPTLETIYSQNGNLALSMLFYACEDTNDDGTCQGNEPHYSQNLPFQAISTHS